MNRFRRKSVGTSAKEKGKQPVEGASAAAADSFGLPSLGTDDDFRTSLILVSASGGLEVDEELTSVASLI